MESVDLRSAGAEVRKIVCEYPEARIILKIDCEGAEVEILESLEESGSIESVSIMMIEWHRWASMDLPDSMEEFLRDRGFAVVGRGWKMRDVGMIYAVRLGNPRSTCADDSRTAKVEDSPSWTSTEPARSVTIGQPPSCRLAASNERPRAENIVASS